MNRTRRGFVARKRRKKILKLGKGFVGSHSKLFQTANQQVLKSLRYSFWDRKKKKNQFRKTWIVRINAESRKYGTKYNMLVKNLKINTIVTNRKINSEINLHYGQYSKALIHKYLPKSPEK